MNNKQDKQVGSKSAVVKSQQASQLKPKEDVSAKGQDGSIVGQKRTYVEY